MLPLSIRTIFLLIYLSSLASAANAPTNLAISAASSSEVKLSWKDNSSDEESFKIERRISGGKFESAATLPANTTSFQDKGLTAGKTYIYQVSAISKAGNSAVIETRISLIPPPEPRGMLASSPSGREIIIQWTDRSENEDGFVIERKTNQPKAKFAEIARGVKANTYKDTTVAAGTIYTYRASAYNAIGKSTFAEATLKAGGAPPPPVNTKIPAWNVPAKIVYSKAFPGFMDIEIYQEKGRYYVRDKIKKTDYKDPRPRRFYYVDMENIGPSLEKGYPLPERGGIYQIQCKRWKDGKDVWDLQDGQVATQWVIKPGPLGVAGELFIPPAFAIDTDDWRDQQHKVIPKFEPILGKASPSYRYNDDQTWDDILSRGASHTAGSSGPEGDKATLYTMVEPVDAMGQQGFMALSKEEITEIASKAPPLAFYVTDWEKQVGWHGTDTYWSTDLLDEKILQNYYFLFDEMNRMNPVRKNGDYYRPIKWNNSFFDQGEARPLSPQFMEQTVDPEKNTAAAFRSFTYFDGTQRSMREVCRVFTIDWYLKSNIFPDRRSSAIYQIYCGLFDTINAKLITPADSTILAFAWFGTDNDIRYRQYIKMEGGWLGYSNRILPSPWWVMTATYIGHLFGDGFHWWHDGAPEGTNNKRRPEPTDIGFYGAGPYTWEPDAGGPDKPPFIFGGTTEHGALYPREPRYNLPYSKLAEYRLKQYENFLTMSRSVVEYSMDAGKSWVTPVGNERRDLLEKTEKKQPICFKWEDGGDLVMVFLAWPFADSPEWNVKLKIAPGQERDVKMHRQWPMLRVFSKSNPNYGL